MINIFGHLLFLIANKQVFMKKILLIFLLLFTSCSTIKYVPIKETEYVTVTETVVDTFIKWAPPIEKIVNETKDTTSTEIGRAHV